MTQSSRSKGSASGVSPKGLIVAAPSSGSGKTIVTLALLRALREAGCDIRGAKAGPDYIDPAFHELASGHDAVNLDPWAMPPDLIRHLADSAQTEFVLVEGMMGLFDGAADGTGSAADLAELLGFPVVLVVDVAKQSHSIAALVRGFRDHRAQLELAGVILNKVGSARHEMLLRDALSPLGVPVLGAIHRSEALEIPERHLGLVQAWENAAMDDFIQQAGKMVANQCDLQALNSLFRVRSNGGTDIGAFIPPIGQRIAIARDEAFSFLYPHLVQGWREAGAELSFFSPLQDEGPAAQADAVFLPGGYPELHAGRLAMAENFRAGMQEAVKKGALIYGECGGYMALGDGLIDKQGQTHAMLGLLRLVTSFEKRKLHLGYRKITPLADTPFAGALRGHEFHYTTAVEEKGGALFAASDALGADLGSCGLRQNRVMGSYLHLIAGGGP